MCGVFVEGGIGGVILSCFGFILAISFKNTVRSKCLLLLDRIHHLRYKLIDKGYFLSLFVSRWLSIPVTSCCVLVLPTYTTCIDNCCSSKDTFPAMTVLPCLHINHRNLCYSSLFEKEICCNYELIFLYKDDHVAKMAL